VVKLEFLMKIWHLPSINRHLSAIYLVVTTLLLSACGFQLRQAPQLVFQTLSHDFAATSVMGKEAVRAMEAAGVRVNAPVAAASAPNPANLPQVRFVVLADERVKTVAGLNASGQVREFQLKVRLKFRLLTRDGKTLIDDTELLATRDISFNETAVLAKEAEEAQLYRNMQSDLVEQLMRRLAAVSSL
jgi:LPS-assembly lipoprotein